MSQAPTDLKSKLKHYRLTSSEYEALKKNLGHEPNNIEWALYSALWSEHCSYKSSKVHLKELFTSHPRVVQGPGENAGVIDLGEGERVAFKMESHNHPSFIEPTQGAATGVGGILRDIFTMGARPMASMDYLCFGEPTHPLTPKLLSGVVKGIGGYGNCVGVPTVNGQTVFHKTYNGNILVNAFNLGLFRRGEEIFYGRATGPGNLIVYAGARTGRDGIHGAAMASESFDSEIEKKKPNVQIGDPFFEKLLIEACLEVMKENLVVGIQDMGAAGLTSSTFEMASRAKSGLRLDLAKVPLREPGITPEEILLSESQERMVLVVEPGNFKRVEEVFHRWNLSVSIIGEITASENVELYWGTELLANVSHKPLVDEAPVYERPFTLPTPRSGTKINVEELAGALCTEAVMQFLSRPELSSRRWIHHQYDQRVGAKTMTACEDDIALLRLPDSGRVLGMTVGCRPLLMEWDARIGAQDAIVLPVLQLAVKGLKALAVTDCLNFGNPEKPEVMGEFVASLQGINAACRAFDTPIISGNVSLYNETLGKSIVGTPSTGVVGLRDALHGPSGFALKEGLDVFLVKTSSEKTWLGEYSSFCRVEPQGQPEIDLDQIKELSALFLELSAHAAAARVIGRGGLITTLTKLCYKDVGMSLDLEEGARSMTETLFAERFYSAIFLVEPKESASFTGLFQNRGRVRFEKIGKTLKENLRINQILNLKVESLKGAYEKGLQHIAEKMA